MCAYLYCVACVHVSVCYVLVHAYANVCVYIYTACMCECLCVFICCMFICNHYCMHLVLLVGLCALTYMYFYTFYTCISVWMIALMHICINTHYHKHKNTHAHIIIQIYSVYIICSFIHVVYIYSCTYAHTVDI